MNEWSVKLRQSQNIFTRNQRWSFTCLYFNYCLLFSWYAQALGSQHFSGSRPRRNSCTLLETKSWGGGAAISGIWFFGISLVSVSSEWIVKKIWQILKPILERRKEILNLISSADISPILWQRPIEKKQLFFLKTTIAARNFSAVIIIILKQRRVLKWAEIENPVSQLHIGTGFG